MPRSKNATEAEKEAYSDGWKAAVSGRPQHERPSYPEHKARLAFIDGWEDRVYQIAMGYEDEKEMAR